MTVRWETRTVEVRFDKVGENPMRFVNDAGKDGWEPFGALQDFGTAKRTLILMKRRIGDDG